ncbi:MAG TPA: hypothetical protein VML75_23200, partial [Kofleriaceae bacterium]|nr:hypothetical protein [Kofleriaceae bacterium]
MRPTCLLLMCALIACGDKKTDEPQPAAPTPAAAHDAAPAAPAPTVLDAKRIEALMAAWLEAQNKGAFADYDKLYAPAFKGVLRVGAKAREMDRAAWMQSRGKMFKNPMTVTMTGATVRAFPKRATVTFVQGFESGRFRDRGPKRIELIAAGDALLIASEEMLESTVTRGRKRVDEGFNNVTKLTVDDRAALEALKPKWRLELTRPLKLGDGREAVLAYYEESHNEVEEDEYGEITLGAYAALAVKKDDRYAVISSTSPRSDRGLELSYYDERDIDGDGVMDTIVVFHGTGFHEAWDGILIVLSKTAVVYDLVYAGGGGEGGEHSWIAPTYACVTQIDGKVAFVTPREDVIATYDFDAEETTEERTYGFAAWVDDGKEMTATTVYGSSLQTAPSADALMKPWRVAVGERAVKPVIHT